MPVDDTPPVNDTPRESLDALRTDLSPIVAACVRADADAFVAVGDRFDDDLRYLTRFSGPDRDFALVVVPAGDHDRGDRAVLCAPSLFDGQARREFVASARVDGSDPDTADATVPTGFHDGVAREVRSANVGDPAGERAVAVLDDLRADLRDDVRHDASRDGTADGTGSAPTVLVPQSIPHDAAVYLERAGYAVVSTAAVSEARAVKTSAEVDRLRRVQRATARGMARAETVLAECTVAESVDGAVGDDVDGPVLLWNGGPLSTERLRRQVNATLAAYGVRDAGNTVIGAGPTAADLHYTGVDVVRPGETVLLDVSPRGPHGYYGDLTRTFVVESDGGWERRAYVAVEAAREAALAEIGPGVTAAAVHREAAAELAAYGFDPNAVEDDPGFTHGTGHGVGVSLHESPSLSSDVELRPGHVVTVEPGVYDPDTGGVRLEDLVAVTDDGYEILSTYPFAMTPSRRDA
ncbi:M24 family metallopeptidase [Halorubrum sp. JWXQ-INN 858]|uniref:M24 family metallopeptidase n=1 Tax=Halorubrum sp. JWXQ-INN 858 TaxID=2690782 RepID=UPI001357D5EC|nr:M24 family metallopeptidase [Halorubrum sp. JWXQ-INN 858]